MRKNEEDQSALLVRCGTGVVLGGAVALLVSLVILFLASVAVSRGALGENLLYQVTVTACAAGAFAGGMLAVRRCGTRALIVGLCTGAVLFLLMLTVGVLFFDARSIERGGIGLASGCLCGGAAAGLLGGGKKRTVRKKHRK